MMFSSPLINTAASSSSNSTFHHRQPFNIASILQQSSRKDLLHFSTKSLVTMMNSQDMMATFSDEEVIEWKARSDVLRHFCALRWFSKSLPETATSIDVINLTDGDVSFYNCLADTTRGLKTDYKLAQYLRDFSCTHADLMANTCTLREQFISHVYHYNHTRSIRQQFFLLHLADSEVAFLQSLAINTAKENGDATATKEYPVLAAHNGSLQKLDLTRCAQENEILLNFIVVNCIAERQRVLNALKQQELNRNSQSVSELSII